MPLVRRRGGAPAWRRVYLLLGYDDADPARDSLRSDDVADQVHKRSPEQLQDAIAHLDRSLGRFDDIVQLTKDYRARGATASGRHALAINELMRFISIAQRSVNAMVRRGPHKLDDRQQAQKLHERASAFAVELDKVAGRALLDYLKQSSPSWVEPAPGLAADQAQRRWVAIVFTILIIALVAGVLWLVFGGGAGTGVDK